MCISDRYRGPPYTERNDRHGLCRIHQIPQNGGLLRRCFRDCHRRGNRRGKNCNTERIKNPVEGEYIYSLRYDEFIAPLICMVQKQQKQIENLERRLSALENKEEAK